MEKKCSHVKIDQGMDAGTTHSIYRPDENIISQMCIYRTNLYRSPSESLLIGFIFQRGFRKSYSNEEIFAVIKNKWGTSGACPSEGCSICFFAMFPISQYSTGCIAIAVFEAMNVMKSVYYSFAACCLPWSLSSPIFCFEQSVEKVSLSLTYELY